MKDVARAHASTFVKYHRGLSAYALLIQPEVPRQRDVRVSWIWGPTGTGKTHWVQMYHETVFMVSAGRDPWNSYSNQETICLDEFNDAEWPITTLNKILDKWPFELDRRYENRCAAWTHVIICSNLSPLNVYASAAPMLVQAFRRRVQNNVYYFPVRGCQPEDKDLLRELIDESCLNLVPLQQMPMQIVPATP